MFRRTILKWIFSSFVPLVCPRWMRAAASGLSAENMQTLSAIGAVVLPTPRGGQQKDDITRRFTDWLNSYQAGADAGYGYGFPRPQVLPASPVVRYPEQLSQLETAAAAKGASFAKLNLSDQKEIIATALKQSKITSLPARPNGKHVAADLMSFFYNSSDGEDCLYDAAIKRQDCRGLATSAQRPARLT